jgi:hypothetical protein
MYKDKMIKGLILIGLFMLPVLGIFVSETQAEKVSKTERARIQSRVMNFADSYAAQIHQSNAVFQQRFSNMTARTQFMQMTLNSVVVAYDIAAGPHPPHSLVNMVVMVTLQRIVWQEHWQPNVFGPQASFQLELLQQLEGEIWSIADKEFSLEQLNILKELILTWRKAHPDQNIVASIRFTDFRSLKEIFRLAESKGLFSGISKAVDTAEELRRLGDRFRYQISRMQLLLNFQLELAYMQLKLAAAAQQVALVTARLPEMTQNAFTKLESESARLRSLLEVLNQTMGTGDELAVEINRAITALDSLVSRFDPIRAEDGVKPIDIVQLGELARDAAVTGRQLNDLLQTADHFLSEQDKEKRLANLVEALAKIEGQGKQLIDFIFFRILVIVVTILFGSFLLAIFYRYISNKYFDTRKRERFSD